MNPFDLNQQHEINQPVYSGLNQFPYPIPPKEIIISDHSSKIEKSIEKASGSLGSLFKFIFFIAGILALISIFPPLVRFLYEFSKWAYYKTGYIFP